ncbi:hypothetical protein [Kitasatospora sp. NPDC002965]|uniref:hypothetical protein n=1 Tax=Kitasatospora sp. NPDC002965 TaxID=3154775 RepID=UPI0033B4D254
MKTGRLRQLSPAQPVRVLVKSPTDPGRPLLGLDERPLAILLDRPTPVLTTG